MTLRRATPFFTYKTHLHKKLQIVLCRAHGDVFADHLLVFLTTYAARLFNTGPHFRLAVIEAGHVGLRESFGVQRRVGRGWALLRGISPGSGGTGGTGRTGGRRRMLPGCRYRCGCR